MIDVLSLGAESSRAVWHNAFALRRPNYCPDSVGLDFCDISSELRTTTAEIGLPTCAKLALFAFWVVASN